MAMTVFNKTPLKKHRQQARFGLGVALELRMHSRLLNIRPILFHNLNPSAQLAPTPSSVPVKWKFDGGENKAMDW